MVLLDKLPFTPCITVFLRWGLPFPEAIDCPGVVFELRSSFDPIMVEFFLCFEVPSISVFVVFFKLIVVFFFNGVFGSIESATPGFFDD